VNYPARSCEFVVILEAFCPCGVKIGEWENEIGGAPPLSCGQHSDTPRPQFSPWRLTSRTEMRDQGPAGDDAPFVRVLGAVDPEE
jgi:hypothetical protein